MAVSSRQSDVYFGRCGRARMLICWSLLRKCFYSRVKSWWMVSTAKLFFFPIYSKACALCPLCFHSSPQDRAGTNSPLNFEVVGGWEVGYPIFVSRVEPSSIPELAGIRVGDQVGLIPMLGLGMRLHVQLHSHTGTGVHVWHSWVEILWDSVMIYYAKSTML